ncbi:MAG TPA: hypothetical protein VM866_06940 [Pyrinomonadaceae bacterium]|nr:hypothetical protein [Pyrinomonadaceae bacterium]
MTSKHRPENLPTRTSRRRFAKTVVAAAAVGVVLSAPSSQTRAQTTLAPKQSPAPPNPQPTPAATPTPSPLAEAYAEVARARFGGKVSPEEFSRIKSDIEGNLRTAERLAAFKLQNSDEPDFLFGA